jgi:geranylgeranyl diphosphate synthase type I
MTPSAASSERRTDLASFAHAVKKQVETRLEQLAKEELADVAHAAVEAREVVAVIFDLALRGGKRVRPLLLSAAHAACGGTDESATIEAGAALEVLHAYLLAHDDWMDGDEVRRGGPSAHAALRERLASTSMGDACAILAGDFGQGLAFDLLARVDLPASRVVALGREAASMLKQVVIGQIIDVRGAAVTRENVDTMHRLKTASYTTTAPLAMGAIIAGADDDRIDALRRVGAPLGLAFQLVDDLLGTFGEEAQTGKSSRSDLRRGKRTALIAELAEDRDAQRLLPRVLGVDDAPDEEVDALIARMIASGAKARVEARAMSLARDARDQVERLPLVSEGKTLLMGIMDTLVARRD